MPVCGHAAGCKALIFSGQLLPLDVVMTAISRVGIGYDIHRLVPGRKLCLGGIHLEFDKGLLGHSDGDAICHAVIDAALGAAGLPDIGEQFPDTDPVYKDADSAKLLVRSLELVAQQGYRIVNIDLVAHMQCPRISPYKQAMRERLAELAGLDVSEVNIKAKTAEGLGPIGSGQAIACTAIVGLAEL